MAVSEFILPISGESSGLSVWREGEGTSGYMLNCRPRDTLEGKIRLGQRPGLKKSFAQQIGGSAKPIIWIGSVTYMD